MSEITDVAIVEALRRQLTVAATKQAISANNLANAGVRQVLRPRRLGSTRCSSKVSTGPISRLPPIQVIFSRPRPPWSRARPKVSRCDATATTSSWTASFSR